MFEEIQFTYYDFLNRITLIYGPSRSGKSHMLTYILSLLSRRIPRLFIFCPTDVNNGCYSGGDPPIAYRSVIFDELEPEWLERLLDMQSALSLKYKFGSNLAHLQKITEMCGKSQEAQQLLNIIDEKYQKNLKDIEQMYSDSEVLAKKEMLTEIKNQSILQLYKGIINSSTVPELTDNLQICYRNMNYNPNVLLIFDDCSEQIRNFMRNNNELFTRLMTKNRWFHITIIMAVHDDSCILPMIRKQAYLNMWMNRDVANAFFNRESNTDRQRRREILQELANVFSKLTPHQKLVFYKGTEKYYKFTAPARVERITFGSEKFIEFTRKITSTDVIGSSNYNHFI